MFVSAAPFSTARLGDYRGILPEAQLEACTAAADALRGARVLHINATLVGGGVAEILLSLVPLMRDAGLDVDWYVLEADEAFFEITKRFHNAFQGGGAGSLPEEFGTYWEGVADNGRQLAGRLDDYDYIVVHDPQPLVLPTLHPHGRSRWIWRCHIDLTQPDPAIWQLLGPHLAAYDMAVFSAPEFVPADIAVDRIETALPCIDPFRSKNRDIGPEVIPRTLRRYGIDPTRPYLAQVSRFDPWKDPVGVVETYRLVKARHPEVQLVYMASMAADDPEGERMLEQTRHAAGDDPDIHLLALNVPPEQVHDNALEVNAMQRGAAVVLQKSLREGFGLTVTEALWKGKAVVAGNVGGIRHQVTDGENGFLVDDIPEAAERCVQLLEDAALRARLGAAGRDSVALRFLFPRLLHQYLEWFGAMPPRRPAAVADGQAAGTREPAVPAGEPEPGDRV